MVGNSVLNAIKAMFIKTLKYVDHHVILPVLWDVKPDGIRSVDEEYRDRIDTLFREIAVKYLTNDDRGARFSFADMLSENEKECSRLRSEHIERVMERLINK